MNEVRLFILINGHEIIGKVTDETDYIFTFEQPLGLQVVPQQDGSYGIQLVPVCSVNSDGNHHVYKHAICMEVEKIPEDIAKAYHSRTSRIILG